MRKLILLLFGVILISCQNKPGVLNAEDYLFKIGETPVSSEEFIYAYSKNNFNKDSVDIRQDINEYLDLFIRFKLKVKEGRNLGLDTTETFKTELEGYRKQLAKPYLSETSITEDLVKEAYQRMKIEVEASHILISVEEFAEPSDTLNAYKKIQKIREEISSGADFATMAKKYSQDPSAKKNGGRLGHFSAFQMVYPFETAAFNTEVGSVSKPIRTRFGYHILNVHNRRDARGRLKVAHIMVRPHGNSDQDSIKAYNKINEIHSQILKGEEWQALCTQFSDDFNSKTKGGELPWFSSGQMIPSFADAAFGLKNEGDISEPVKTPYGWHIIRLDDKENIKPFEEEKDNIEIKLARDSRGELSKKFFLLNLKKEHGFVESRELVEKILNFADSSLLRAQWQTPQLLELNETQLFQLGDNTYKAKDFLDYVILNQKRQTRVSPRAYMNSLYESFVEETLMTFEESILGIKYPEYRMLLNEYHEGIMLFELMDKKVWTKAVKDTLGLRSYYDMNISTYQWAKRAEVSIYSCQSQKIANSIKAILASNDSTTKTKKALEEQFNQNSQLTLQIENGLFEISQHRLLSKIKELKTGEYTIESEGRVNYILVENILEPGNKTLNEVRGLVISDYQKFLEEEWIGQLKVKYEVKTNKKELERIISELDRK